MALHVRTHQRAVCVVVFKERNHRRCNRDQLLGRNVHIIDLFGLHLEYFIPYAHHDALVGKPLAGLVKRFVGLRDDVLVLFVSGHVGDLVRYLLTRPVDAAVRRFNKAVLVDACKRRERVDQAYVRAFRRLDWAHAAVMAEVHVAYLERGAFAVEAAGAQRAQTALMRKLRERVCLVHELREL
ncbi:hypothetical protein SDC9_171585 [bioreactor metagenome]|uniref:Uncharacterized protein n=1 Tax=bioreactor metagenome TaxID=1076179 RepID=A0A645GBC5_9ZZZZ